MDELFCGQTGAGGAGSEAEADQSAVTTCGQPKQASEQVRGASAEDAGLPAVRHSPVGAPAVAEHIGHQRQTFPVFRGRDGGGAAVINKAWLPFAAH